MTDIERARVLRDLHRFAELQTTLGQDAVREMVATALGFDDLRLVNVTQRWRRDRIRRAARARKARRGWR